MKRNAYADSTIEATGKRLRNLAKNCDLTDPESIKAYVAQMKCSNGFKESLIEAYDILIRASGGIWSKPFYERYDRLPKIPSEERLNMLISNASKRMSLVLSMMRDLGTRPIELTWLKVRDLDLERGIVNITSAKYCVGRAVKLKSTTLDMLKQYILRKGLRLDDRLFPVKSSSLSESYRKLRNRLSVKLQDPVFRTIRLYDWRHFKASMTYHQTKDLMLVRSILGHRDLRTTLRYVQLLGDLGSDEWIVKATSDVKEVCQLVEHGFQYVTDIDGLKIFRKPK